MLAMPGGKILSNLNETAGSATHTSAPGLLVGLGKPGQAYHDGEVEHASPDELPMIDIRQR
jgi:hypothetical protein